MRVRERKLNSTIHSCLFIEKQPIFLPFSGVWYTEYAYIDYDRDISTPTECSQRNANSPDGYRRVWAKPTYFDTTYRCLILPGPPECVQAGWSRDNHLGNGRDGVPLNYTWKIPYFPSETQKLIVVRIR